MKKTASISKRAPAKEVGAYLGSMPEELRAFLNDLRTAIKAAAPNTHQDNRKP